MPKQNIDLRDSSVCSNGHVENGKVVHISTIPHTKNVNETERLFFGNHSLNYLSEIIGQQGPTILDKMILGVDVAVER